MGKKALVRPVTKLITSQVWPLSINQLSAINEPLSCHKPECVAFNKCDREIPKCCGKKEAHLAVAHEMRFKAVRHAEGCHEDHSHGRSSIEQEHRS